MLVLFGDTDCDVTPEIAKEYGAGLISMPYSVDGKTIFPYEDFDVFDSKAFYQSLRDGALPTTSAVIKEKYIEYFEPVFKNGDDIIYVHFSKKLSTTFNNMNKAVDELLAKYPERKFYAVDTKGITALGLNIFLEAGDLLKAGAGAEEIVEWAKTECDRFAVYLFADDLKFFRRSGRVGGLAATMGTLLGVRPIIYMNEAGDMLSIGKEKGRAKAVARLISYLDELGDDVSSHRIIIAHTDAEDIADELEAAVREKYPNANILRCAENPTAGSHSGPDSAAICFHSVHR